MPELEKAEAGLLDTLAVLKEVLPEIILVGGWCPFLYAQHVWKKSIPKIPTTTDIDLGVLETGPRRFETTIYERLKSAGFALEQLYEGEKTPVEFIYKKKSVKLKVEFITSLTFKRDKDLFYVYFILKFHPDRKLLLTILEGLKKDEYFRAFRENIREYLADFSSPGYLILRPFLRGWIEEGNINAEIQNTFSEVLKLIG